jgi:hypothetical protein
MFVLDAAGVVFPVGAVFVVVAAAAVVDSNRSMAVVCNFG